MPALFIIAHAPLASALRATALHVFPDCQADLLALDVVGSTALDDTQQEARRMLDELLASQASDADPGSVLILSDMVGATPCNVAQRLISDPRIRLVTGVNLPMLLRTLTYRHEALPVLAGRAVSGGMQGVMHLGGTAPQIQASHRLRSNDHPHGHHQQ